MHNLRVLSIKIRYIFLSPPNMRYNLIDSTTTTKIYMWDWILLKNATTQYFRRLKYVYFKKGTKTHTQTNSAQMLTKVGRKICLIDFEAQAVCSE